MKIGILHPGSMGASLAEQAISAGHEVSWCTAGRSNATKLRAREAGLVEMNTLVEICDSSEILISVCPPSAAEAMSTEVLAAGFTGLYVEANAISPQRSAAMAAEFLNAGVSYVDGGIVGPPAIGDRRNFLYLSGPEANRVTEIFAGSQVTPMVIGDDYSKASAMKMCFASHTKGGWALTLNTLATAQAYGVREDLLAVWETMGRPLTEQQKTQLETTARKAWRFEGEMNEIADTLENVNLPNGSYRAAAEIYRRLADFKDDGSTSLNDVLDKILNSQKLPDV
jgi:3-hydroxyisobutyrate dehydrogenase-like beta-hydroxyacid dehydrogenase